MGKTLAGAPSSPGWRGAAAFRTCRAYDLD